jgi:hypothetical protein
MCHRGIMHLVASAVLLVGVALGSSLVELPPRGKTSPEAIRECEARLAKLEGIQKIGDENVIGYMQMNPGADSLVYFFTSPSDPAHPSMIEVTLHPMRDPLRPQKDEIEFRESYASSEEQYIAWRKRVMVDFGRGFAIGAYEAARKQPSDGAQ